MKVAYSRNIGDNEVVLMCGYVGEGKCVVIVKDSDNEIIKDYGILPQNEAFDIYNTESRKDILFLELYNFIENLSKGSESYNHDFITHKSKLLLPLVKYMVKDLK